MKLSKQQEKQLCDFLISIGRKIHETRKKKGLSQLDLAYAIGMEKPNLRQIEKGKRNITLKTLMVIAEGLNVPLKSLLPE